MNYTSSSTPLLAKAARYPLWRTLMIGFLVLLLGYSHKGMAAPGHSGKDAGKPAYTYSILVKKDFSVAGSGNPDILQITVSPTPPYPPGLSLQFSISSVGYTPILTTDANGIVTLDFASTIVGPVTVDVYNGPIDPANLVVTQVLNFIAAPGPVDLSKSYLQVVQNPAGADGVAQDIVQAVLFDANGNAEPSNTPVTFSTEIGTATISTTGLSVGNVVTADFTSFVVGNVQVQAKVPAGFINDQSTPPNNFVSIQFVVLPPSLANSYIVAVTATAPADDHGQDVVEAVVYNSLGKPVPDGTAVTFTYNVAGTTMTTTGTTLNGIATADFTSLIVGPVQVQAQVSIAGVPTFLFDQNNPANNFVTIQFVTGPPVNSNPSNPTPPGGGGPGSGTGPSNPSDPSGPGGGFTYLTMTFNNVPADGVSTDTATAYITDAEGHPIAGVPVYFSFHTGGPANGGTLFQPFSEIIDTVLTNANGYAAVPITSTITGDAWIDATIQPAGLIAGSYATAHFTQAPDVNNPETQLIVLVYEALADGHSTTEVKAHIVDASGQPVADAVVQFAIDSGNAQIITPGPYTTDANGDVIIQLTSTTPGNVYVTATVSGGKAIKFGSPAKMQFAAINIYVPRVFTPNGDGANDVLRPILVGISTFHYFSVYNRWGNLIFTTQDPNQGWDGTFKGVAQPVETYLWIAEGIDLNGKKIVAKGMTSLVR